MNLSDIITKCYILALIIRDDGERLLLGDGIYEFKSSLQHFAPNIYQNDVVELQGTDGQLLAGQVRRSATQAFDGYIADGTIGKTDTEQSRRRFLGFFRKKHHYKVVYIMPDGTAVQRDRGYIVDAPAVQELYQRFPEYHIGLNFEDPNYYEYAENDEGEEIYTHIQAIALFRELEAGLVWDAFGAVSDDIVWAEYMTENSTDGYILIGNGLPVEAPLSLTHFYGNATQTTISGKNLLPNNGATTTIGGGVDITKNDDGTYTVNGTASSGGNFTIGSIDFKQGQDYTISGLSGWTSTVLQLYTTSSTAFPSGSRLASYSGPTTRTAAADETCQVRIYVYSGNTYDNVIVYPMVELGSEPTEFVKYVGGSDSPNPITPQPVNVVTGEQTVKITGKNLFDNTATPPVKSNYTNITYTPSSIRATLTNTPTQTRYAVFPVMPLSALVGKTITFSVGNISSVDASPRIRLVYCDSTGNNRYTIADYTTSNHSYSLVIPDTRADQWIGITIYATTTSSGALQDGYSEYENVQLEISETATQFEPYQAQSYTIDLGSLELAKIDDYTDGFRIIDGTWYIHKETGKVILDGTENWNTTANNNAYYITLPDGNIVNVPNTSIPPMMSDYYTPEPYRELYDATYDYATGVHPNQPRIMIRNKDCADSNALKTWLTSHNTTVYYALATPTDTEITDSELLEQLNHIYELYQGTNNVWLIPSAGAQGEMTVRFGVAYDDDGSGYHWSEELGSPDNIISNDGIDSVRPIWTINGPATNPTLTNITTAQTIAWNGTVPADATLTIDMERQTATLNGANVYAQIEGDWLELAVGPNKLQYTASGGATADSTLEWNGVAG